MGELLPGSRAGGGSLWGRPLRQPMEGSGWRRPEGSHHPPLPCDGHTGSRPCRPNVLMTISWETPGTPLDSSLTVRDSNVCCFKATGPWGDCYMAGNSSAGIIRAAKQVGKQTPRVR